MVPRSDLDLDLDELVSVLDRLGPARGAVDHLEARMRREAAGLPPVGADAPDACLPPDPT